MVGLDDQGLCSNRKRNPFGLVNSTFSVINDGRTSWIDVCLPMLDMWQSEIMLIESASRTS